VKLFDWQEVVASINARMVAASDDSATEGGPWFWRGLRERGGTRERANRLSVE
jgi:hypothetical protein